MLNRALAILEKSLDSVLKKPRSRRWAEVLTWAIDGQGKEVPLSRYGDDRIDMGPYLPNPASPNRYIVVHVVPDEWKDSYLDVLLTYWKRGCPGYRRPKASTVVATASGLTTFVCWLNGVGLSRFSEVRPIHFHEYAEFLKAKPIESGTRAGKLRTPLAIAALLSAAQLPWRLREFVTDSISENPFASRGRRNKAAQGERGSQKQLMTYCMSWGEVVALYQECERSLDRAEETLTASEARTEYWRNAEINGLKPHPSDYCRWIKRNYSISARQLGKQVTELREAASTQLLLLVGIRISEFVSLKVGCATTRNVGDEPTLWITGVNYKSAPEGEAALKMEWMAPKRAGVLVEYLSRLSDEHRGKLQKNIDRIRAGIADGLDEGVLARSMVMLRNAERAKDSIILSRCRGKGEESNDDVGIINSATLEASVSRVARRAGISSKINPHVLRRTFAFMVAHQCHGDLRYLRKHFQHWSIDTTAAYASHPERDLVLSDSIGVELLERKTDLVSRWLQEDEVLAGAGGRHIEATRQSPEFRAHTLKDRRQLAVVLQNGLNVRPTGHGWCIASGGVPCGGRGLYDPKECASGCSGAVITKEELPVWRRLTEQMLEVERMSDCGPAVAKSVGDSLVAFDSVLSAFGLSVDSVRMEMRGRANGS